LATKLHNQMTGADLHPNAIDGTTGTELSVASQTTYDGRWMKGPASATNNAVVRYDGTTGKLVKTSIVTIDDTGALNVSSDGLTVNTSELAVRNSSKVGIGTNNPSRPLTIQGRDINNDIVQFRNNSGTDKWHFAIKNGVDIDVVESGVASNRLYLKAGGNVGIGTSSPGSLLTVAGSVASQGETITPTANSTTTLQVTKADGTTNVLVVDTTNQRIGVNIASPSVPLSLGVAIANTKLAVYDGGSTLYGFGIGSSQFRIHVGSSSDRFAFLNAPAGTEVFTVLGTGNVGIGASGPHTALQIVGPLATAITTTAKTTAYTATATDSTILADASGGTFQITLPTAVGCAGRQYTIKRTGATNNVTVGGTSAQTLDGAITKTLGSQNATLTVQSDNANWQMLSTLGTGS
jgi:hypothetical protein